MIIGLGLVGFALAVGLALVVLHKAAEIRDNLSGAYESGLSEVRADRIEPSRARAAKHRDLRARANAGIGIVETVEPRSDEEYERLARVLISKAANQRISDRGRE